ncbi:sigma-54-dependent transcriptional regulator [Blastopirellula retiformator]|uniref:DNA-binding transcriptional regulator NtrC n=1 Tax=Blastopirellula retiformator TaxID=2527970 RepID=A0A5C5VLJ6_9BACT|nr:sigma-54 dependent transcriptional regulator [Blastopirellula retiformator]TWT38897.1 Nitrogen regulation protein NR(I) [Blastopirellula retiformator]
MTQILVVDDDRAVARLVQRCFEGSEVDVLTSQRAAEVIPLIEKHTIDVLLLDIMLPEINGLDLARQIRQIDSKLPIIFVTGRDDSETTIEAMKLGAYDYLVKPLDVGMVQELVERAIENRRLMHEPVVLTSQQAEENESGDLLIGRSPQMLAVYKEVGRVAAQNVNVLVRGESGSGKELIARAIYQHSNRNSEPFLAVNCAALRETLLESELFGHEKGAFTGADSRRIGKFEQCNGGTIFLDEVGDMSLTIQAKVLRLLQDQRLERLGGAETITTDVRIISATNRDLEEMIADGDFRLDLFHRLKSFEIAIPPLRDRDGDLEQLVQYFLKQFNKQLGKEITGLSAESLARLKAYDWPGNIRELQEVLRKSMLMATSTVLAPEWLPPELFGGAAPIRPSGESQGSDEDAFDVFLTQLESRGSENMYAESLEWMEQRLLSFVLDKTAGNQSKAAALLGITRGSLRHKMRALGITVEQVVKGDE